MKKTILSILLGLICFAIALVVSLRLRFDNPYPVVCQFVAEKIYLSEYETENWKKICLQRSQLVRSWSSKGQILADISNTLGILQLSHLEVFYPQQVKRIWRGVSAETGVESEFVDGNLVIFKVHPGSAAASAGLRYGDIIIKQNNESPNPWRVRDTSGFILYKRGEKELEVYLKTIEFARDESIQVQKIDSRSWLIQVPSFRREFFEKDVLVKHQKELSNAELIVIDLRGNQGGNFVSGLRFLSKFICSAQTVGRLVKPKNKTNIRAPIPNDLDDLLHLKRLNAVHSLELETFQTSECLNAKLRVLIDSKTSSVAEMVAQAFKELKHSPIGGSTSSGQLLVGVWYPLNELGQGVQISIPEAVYKSSGGHQIEGRGVTPDKVLYYNLEDMQKGHDPWIKAALGAWN